jgi:hypothetical protein
MYQALLNKTTDATACMILLACPNIKTLEIVGHLFHRTQEFAGSLLGYLLEIAAHTLEPSPSNQVIGMSSPESHVSTQLPGLQKSLILQHVENLKLDMWYSRLTSTQIGQVLSLPSLRVLCINNLDAIDAIGHGVCGMTINWPRCAQLNTLVLEICSLPGHHVAELIKLCPKLVTFNAS